MSHDTQPAPLPAAHERGEWQAFRIVHPGELMAMLRQLRDGSVPVQLSGPGGHALTATLWAMDEQRHRMNFSLDPQHRHLPELIEADECVAVAYLDNVKLQFDLHAPVLVHGVGSTTLQTAWPHEAYRFQRRNAYRVRTLERSSPTAHLRHPAMPDMLLPLRVIDVSIGGCALFVPHEVPPLQPGTQLGSVRIELDSDTRFETGLQLQHVTDIHPGQHGVRIGCEWLRLSTAAERTLQRYIDQTQKRRRQLAMD